MKGLRSSHRWGSTKVGGEEESKNFCGSTKDVEQRSSGALFVGEPMFVGGPSLVWNHGGARPRCMGIDTSLAPTVKGYYYYGEANYCMDETGQAGRASRARRTRTGQGRGSGT
jgi:hypothetical protein